MSLVVVGLGSSAADALDVLREAVARLDDHPLVRVVSVSGAYESPAAGGVTAARFVNAAAVVDTALSPRALLGALHAEEARAGRVRALRNASRSLDLDVLLVLDAPAPFDDGVLAVPHPRLHERAFAVFPALDAVRRAGCPPPPLLVDAARALALAPLFLRRDADLLRREGVRRRRER